MSHTTTTAARTVDLTATRGYTPAAAWHAPLTLGWRPSKQQHLPPVPPLSIRGGVIDADSEVLYRLEQGDAA